MSYQIGVTDYMLESLNNDDTKFKIGLSKEVLESYNKTHKSLRAFLNFSKLNTDLKLSMYYMENITNEANVFIKNNPSIKEKYLREHKTLQIISLYGNSYWRSFNQSIGNEPVVREENLVVKDKPTFSKKKSKGFVAQSDDLDL